MGKPLKPAWRETPILYGEDARRFMKRMENPPKWSKEKKEDFTPQFGIKKIELEFGSLQYYSYLCSCKSISYEQ